MQYARWVTPVTIFTVGTAVGTAATLMFAPPRANLTDVSHCDGYEFLNPYIRCSAEENLAKKQEFSDTKAFLQDRIYAWKGQGRIDHASIYLRDLQMGPVMGIAEDEPYSSASLLKVAVMLAILRQEELRPGILNQRIEVQPEFLSSYEHEINPTASVEAGKTYTTDDLLEYMIVHSDNNATNVLSSYLNSLSDDGSPVLRTLEELGFIGQFKTDDLLSVKQSASMFRMLYNASYLNKSLSQKALDLLARTTFDKGIVSGLPGHIRVAHKFGERIKEDGMKQLHDCGIFYAHETDYLLCVMTQGTNIPNLESTIRDITEIIYKEVENREAAEI